LPFQGGKVKTADAVGECAFLKVIVTKIKVFDDQDTFGVSDP
jgi:hypothetical protein